MTPEAAPGFCHGSEVRLPGVSPDEPTHINERGGGQSALPYRADLLPFTALLSISRVLKTGADKYGPDNWRKIDQDDHLNHALVHIMAWLAGDRQDDHLSHAACRMLFAMETERASAAPSVDDIDWDSFLAAVGSSPGFSVAPDARPTSEPTKDFSDWTEADWDLMSTRGWVLVKSFRTDTKFLVGATGSKAFPGSIMDSIKLDIRKCHLANDPLANKLMNLLYATSRPEWDSIVNTTVNSLPK